MLKHLQNIGPELRNGVIVIFRRICKTSFVNVNVWRHWYHFKSILMNNRAFIEFNYKEFDNSANVYCRYLIQVWQFINVHSQNITYYVTISDLINGENLYRRTWKRNVNTHSMFSWQCIIVNNMVFFSSWFIME